MIKDVYSRKLVANEVHVNESAEQAAQLLRQACLREPAAGTALGQRQCDEGLDHAGGDAEPRGDALVQPPRMSNDNAYAEALFRTAKYCPLWPERPFETLEQARNWVNRFMDWYNHEHRHSALKFVTPAQRRAGQAQELLHKRIELYEAARARHPERWSGKIRNWSLAPIVCLNPREGGGTATNIKGSVTRSRDNYLENRRYVLIGVGVMHNLARTGITGNRVLKRPRLNKQRIDEGVNTFHQPAYNAQYCLVLDEPGRTQALWPEILAPYNQMALRFHLK